MTNPLAIFHTAVLEGLLQAGYVYYVWQSYPRGYTAQVKESLLISFYRSLQEAKAHYDAMPTDQRRYLYQAMRAEDLEKLRRAAAQPEGYAVFAALLKEKKWKPGIGTGPAIRRYLRIYSNWKAEGRESLKASLFIQFGELFVTLKRGQEEIKVPLSAIEKT